MICETMHSMKTVIASHWTTEGDKREHRPSAVLAREMQRERRPFTADSAINMEMKLVFKVLLRMRCTKKKLASGSISANNISALPQFSLSVLKRLERKL